jgi:Xaa-Pro aminopeptidase
MDQWLCQVLPARSTVAIDPQLFTIAGVKSLRESLEASGHTLVSHPHNLVDTVWETRPPRPDAHIQVLDVQYAGKPFNLKLAELRQDLSESGCSAVVVSALDEIAWLFNLRGSDVDFNPVFLSYALVTLDSATLYVDLAKVTPLVYFLTRSSSMLAQTSRSSRTKPSLKTWLLSERMRLDRKTYFT